MLSLTDVLPLDFLVSQVRSGLLLFLIFFQDFLEPLQKLQADSKEGGERGVQLCGQDRSACLGVRAHLTWQKS